MKILIVLVSSIFLTVSIVSAQTKEEYQVFAIKFREIGNFPASGFAVGANNKDSVQACNMFWFLKGTNDRRILVDVGFIDPYATGANPYLRPDQALERINIAPADITDIIITHPHMDHIGGIELFPNAIVWIQKEDYYYFIGDAWQEDGTSAGFTKDDVRHIVEINLQGKLQLVDGDDIEIIPGIKVFTGSKHTYQNQYVLVNSNSERNKILIASDAIWTYYNLNNLLPIPYFVFDSNAYIEAMIRMKTLVSNAELIIPGHDDLVFSKFEKVTDWIVRIEE